MSLDAKTFSVLDAVQGRSYPTDKVTVYTDADSIYRLSLLEEKANSTLDQGEVDEIEKQIAELKEEITKSGLTFHMRGFSPGVRQSLFKEAEAKFEVEDVRESLEAISWLTNRVIAESIIRVENAAGALDERRWNVEDVENISNFLITQEFDKLNELASSLSFKALKFDNDVTPDFS